ncbi:hypothetical protein [Nocardia colli]|uniref:hypothetical protein n=1 Tax=Nocardia colli TaxID=2545717 RepID=UPI001CC3C007|nr:hypothetical protein [Nocardia colli]
MGVLVINWETYYDAAKKCHALAADLRAADKPVHDALKGECAGMAGDTAGCESWGKEYDRAVQGTLQTCTNLADALTNFGYMLSAAGYNWALSNNSNTMPDRPAVTAMTEHKVSLPTSVGNNGDGITEGDNSVPGFYDALVGKIQEEFGSKLPNGHKEDLAKAASVWKTFSEHTTIKGAPGRIAEISDLFADIKDKGGGLESLLGHLTTLKGGATQLAAASVNIAAPVSAYSEGTSEVRDKFKEAVTNALIAAGATVVIGVAAAWITAALSAAAAGAGVVVIAGNTARVLKTTYDISKLYRIIGAAAAAAGAGAAAITAFKDVDLTQEALKLGVIVTMKVFLDEGQTVATTFDDLPAAPDNPAPGLTDEAEKYILGKHIEGAANYTPRKGTWPAGTTGEDLDDLVEAAENSPARGPNGDGNFEREITAPDIIGNVSKELGGAATRRYKVVTDRFGGVITMYPIP